MKIIRMAPIVAGLLLLGCSSAEKPPVEVAKSPEPVAPAAVKFVSVPELKELMAKKVEVDAEALWNAAVDETAPKTSADWKRLDDAAARLVEAGHAIMQAPLAKDGGRWKEESQKMIDMVEICRKAIKDKNRDALIDSGNKLTEDSCSSCHKVYFNPA